MRRGYSIIEVLVAGGLGLLLMLIIWGAFRMLDHSTQGVRASNEPRQQMRVFMANLQNDIRAAAYIFPAGNYTVAGYSISVPAAGAAGDGLIFAVPQNSETPILYTVVSVFTEARQPTDPNTPNALSLVTYTVEDVDPPLSDLPGEIDPNTLPLNGERKVFDAYIEPGGFECGLTPTGDAVRFRLSLRRKEARGEVQTASFQTTLALRNIR